MYIRTETRRIAWGLFGLLFGYLAYTGAGDDAAKVALSILAGFAVDHRAAFISLFSVLAIIIICDKK